jgi:hypothetical protein
MATIVPDAAAAAKAQQLSSKIHARLLNLDFEPIILHPVV